MVNSATQLLLHPRIASSASSEGGGEVRELVSFLAFCCWAHIWVTAQVRAAPGYSNSLKRHLVRFLPTGAEQWYEDKRIMASKALEIFAQNPARGCYVVKFLRNKKINVR